MGHLHPPPSIHHIDPFGALLYPQGDMATGTVKWFNSGKGYGFIAREEGNDLFVHRSNIADGGYDATLEEGQTVEFEVGPGSKGEEAKKVRLV